jgi:hypothetical protein
MQLPLQLVHAFLLDIDALEDHPDSHPDPDLDPDLGPDLKSIKALALSSLPTSDTLDHHYYQGR